MKIGHKIRDKQYYLVSVVPAQLLPRPHKLARVEGDGREPTEKKI